MVARPQRDHVVEDTGAGDGGVVLEVEFFRFEGVGALGADSEGRGDGGVEGEIGEQVSFLADREIPEDKNAVGEDEEFGGGERGRVGGRRWGLGRDGRGVGGVCVLVSVRLVVGWVRH